MTTAPQPAKHVHLALLLGVASAICVVLLFPYLLTLIPKLREMPIPLGLAVPIQAVQGGVQVFLLSWIGLRLGKPLGLDSPILRAWVYRAPAPARTGFALAAMVGAATGGPLLLLDRYLFMPLQPAAIQTAGARIPRLYGFLASFYGGIAEEIITRLFLMSLLAWLIAKLQRRATGATYVAALLLAAALFAAGHLPAAAQITSLTAPVVVRVLTLNGLAGVPFGILFWKRGLEHSMVAHFCADLVLHVLGA